MFLEFLANLGVDLSIHIVAQYAKKLLAFHDFDSIRLNLAFRW
jgi:hypothetical protein